MKKAKLILAALCAVFTMALVVGCNNNVNDNAGGTYYSYEATNSNGTTFKYDADGNVIDGDETHAPGFIQFTLASGNKWTKYETDGMDLFDSDIANYCTYTLADGTLTINAGVNVLLTATASGEEYTATYHEVAYKFKK